MCNITSDGNNQIYWVLGKTKKCFKELELVHIGPDTYKCDKRPREMASTTRRSLPLDIDDDVLTLVKLKPQLYYETVNYIKTCNMKVF